MRPSVRVKKHAAGCKKTIGLCRIERWTSSASLDRINQKWKKPQSPHGRNTPLRVINFSLLSLRSWHCGFFISSYPDPKEFSAHNKERTAYDRCINYFNDKLKPPHTTTKAPQIMTKGQHMIPKVPHIATKAPHP